MHDEDEKTPIFNIMCTGLVSALAIFAVTSFFKPGTLSYIIMYITAFFGNWFICTMGTVLVKPKWKLDDQCIVGAIIAVSIFLTMFVFK